MNPSRFLLLIVICMMVMKSRGADLPGTWEVLVENARIASMHTVVTHFDTVVLLDRTDLSPTEERHQKYHCQIDPKNKQDPQTRPDCYSYSVHYNLANQNLQPLTINTDTWCSSGQVLPDGTILQTGGDNDGFKKIRKFTPCETTSSACDWEELKDIELAEGRWYALFLLFLFPFLTEAVDDQMDNLYPYVHLLPNGHLFVFANNKSVREMIYVPK
nr:hypothetical protein [Tanacetum cinerariifolium]